jgi:hypothetical protein
MSKIPWILNDVPSLPLSTLRVSNDIFLGDPTNLVRKFNLLSDNIEAELGVPVWFDITYGAHYEPIITVIDL